MSERPSEPPADLRIFGLPGIPEIEPGADLAGLILDAAARLPLELQDGDLLVVAQKAVSKAEGRVVDLRDIEPSPFATQVGEAYGKDPRHVEIILRESSRVVRMDRGVIICETRHGFICANAGVDLSNVPGDYGACLLPIDPDASAEQLRQAVVERTSARVAVIVSDTFGRPWREGVVNVAIGVAGFQPLETYIGQVDTYGYELHTTVMAPADELASAAELVQRKLRQMPVAVVRGYGWEPGEGAARQLVRQPGMDLFR
jgi:coenzyme F420-0:L-glutamate ligase/coenzyme F420-1:gamma-L-glutamate ligase